MAFECGNHPGADACWMCVGCEGVFCGDCVVERSFGRTRVQTCKGCGELCNPVAAGITVEEVHLGASFGGAFAYPFRGDGGLVLLGGTLFATLLEAFASGLGSLIAWGLLLGYGMTVIRTTADGRDTPPQWQDVGSVGELFKPMLLAVATALISFGPAQWAAANEEGTLAVTLLVAGAAYAPMAWIAASVSGNLLAITPLTVLPLLLRVNASYWAACVLLVPLVVLGRLGTDALGGMMPGLLGLAITTSMAFYLLLVEMRILGLVWAHNGDELGFG